MFSFAVLLFCCFTVLYSQKINIIKRLETFKHSILIKILIGVGSTWVMFAGVMSPYDLEVFLLHQEESKKIFSKMFFTN